MNKILTFVLLSSVSMNGFGFELLNGSEHRDTIGFSEADKLQIWDYEDWVSPTIKDKFSSIVAFHESADIAFVLSRSLHIGEIDVQEKLYLGNWPLNYSPYQYTPKLANEQHRAIDTFLIKTFDLESGGIGPGCMGNTPLRYGDIENDGESEIVLTLGRIFVVFSPKYERVVFSDYVRLVDELDPASYQRLYGDQAFPEAQFVSDLAAINGYPRMPAIRYYTKVFTGDFDEDGYPDIISWHKGYLSRRSDDATSGYELKEEAWTHYERDLVAQESSKNGITGHYIPQETAESDIQDWLAENNLTWSKGNPAKSECPGEEGQLIPEMHDPLLNDPDVLK
ncbi:hypothetical protein [Reinekea sp. G2M2-21]|uniref:hypothetical protein n=1 Tax=Reinekea sp. G2M2-21 TaxID=2788942 RepID=UPI0018A8F69E|nr:hypothetical protein [Reinekea sp. G2M2-21]